jgi:lysophospholipase L1-like esterase
MATRRYLALGDSYTIGEGVDLPGTWPMVLAAALRTRGGTTVGDDATMSVDVIARTGWTADELVDALAHAELRPPYDLVSVLIGVNDQYRHRETSEHLPHFNTLLSQAIAFADGDASRVFVVSIPDWGVAPFAQDDPRGRRAIGEAIDAYNEAQRELCTLRGLAYVDITADSRAVADDPSMFVDDRLHPSALQYARWARRIEPVAWQCVDGHG